MNGIRKVLRTHLRKGSERVSMKTTELSYSKKKKRNQEEYEDIESDFSRKYLFNKDEVCFLSFPQDTTINKVIEQISQNSGIVPSKC